MPHQCTNCGRTFADGSKEMLSGCPDCSGTKFQFRPDGFDTDTGDAGDAGDEGSDAPDTTAVEDSFDSGSVGDDSLENRVVTRTSLRLCRERHRDDPLAGDPDLDVSAQAGGLDGVDATLHGSTEPPTGLNLGAQVLCTEQYISVR